MPCIWQRSHTQLAWQSIDWHAQPLRGVPEDKLLHDAVRLRDAGPIIYKYRLLLSERHQCKPVQAVPKMLVGAEWHTPHMSCQPLSRPPHSVTVVCNRVSECCCMAGQPEGPHLRLRDAWWHIDFCCQATGPCALYRALQGQGLAIQHDHLRGTCTAAGRQHICQRQSVCYRCLSSRCLNTADNTVQHGAGLP